ncbi:GNAT family N-acetyltransferase [Rossellomorea marisflavi]|uniref:GNAT family N-acetyltransferase n=1 Tax=Rossellomorea marisflavi TaxID=189381 RepID=UPI0034584F7C
MEIEIQKLDIKDFKKLYEFEFKNKDFFEKLIPPRDQDYYDFEKFKDKNKVLLNEQDEGISYYFLIKDSTGSIIGRINLVDIDSVNKTGYLGYRVGEKNTRKGVAKKALKILLEIALSNGIKVIKAKTTDNNIASQKILEHNGFTKINSPNKEFEMNGMRLKFVNYEWYNI